MSPSKLRKTAEQLYPISNFFSHRQLLLMRGEPVENVAHTVDMKYRSLSRSS